MEDAVTLLSPLARNVEILKSRLNAPLNADVIVRRFRSGAFESAVIAIDGMVNAQRIDENILKPCMALPAGAGAEADPQERAAYLMENAVSILPMKMKDNVDEILSDVLGGQCALLCDGCAAACVMDTRGFEKRTIGKPEAEQVVLGPHESFSESIRTNITLLRRIVQREDLITEFVTAGGKMHTRCALLYLRGTADEQTVLRIRSRLEGCTYDFALTTGETEQLIEDHPLALIPQCVRTERPDRAASFLAEGQVVVLTDGSPAALGAPATLYHQLHTPDDASMRWQYGTFLRMVRTLGMLIHVFLPGLYLAVIRFHQELLSPMLLTSVYETSSRVPVPHFLEALLMTLAFDLINEAGLRAPGAMGNALGIVSGLILGQSAVSADIVSPLLLIVVAASGLGGFCVPSYALSIGLKIVQLMMLAAGAAGGLFAMSLLLTALLCALCAMRSFGMPLTAPLSPHRPHNPDIFLRLPLTCQRAAAFFFRLPPSAQRIRAACRAQACAAGLCVGAQVFLFGTGVAAPLALNAVWIGSLVCPPLSALLAARCRRAMTGRPSRAACLLLALTLLLHAVFAAACLVALSEQTLLVQARAVWSACACVLFLALCAIGKSTGVLRLCFAVRFALPAALTALVFFSLPVGQMDGLFPLLGPGGQEVLLSALCMAGAVSPALLLLLPPDLPPGSETEEFPPARFFALRALAGAAAGVLLLFLLSLCRSHVSIASLSALGDRLQILGGAQAHKGIPQALITVLQVIATALLACAMLCGAERALCLAAPVLAKGRAALIILLLILFAALLAMTVFGFGVLFAFPAVAVPAALCLLLAGRRKTT